MKQYAPSLKVAARCTIVLISLGLVGSLFGITIAETTRALADEWQDVIVGVKIVQESFDYESKIEVVGTVIDESGLVVLSLSSIDPSSLHYGSDGDTKIKDVKITLTDGTEIQAEVALRDRDLDLVFVRPMEKIKTKLKAVDLAKAAAPQLADQVIVLSRLGSASGYAPHVSLCRIQAVITKPRVFYVPDFMAVLSGLGTPAFTPDGQIIGVLLIRITTSAGQSMGEVFGGIRSMGVLPVILPAQDIAKAAQHVPDQEK